MKKILLSSVALATLATSTFAQSELEVLQAQVTALSAKVNTLKASKDVVEVAPIKKYTTIKSKAPILKFSGKHYLGFVSDSETSVQKFETRRNYFQVKGYFAEDSKDYFRITLDTEHDAGGSWLVRLKYAYLYLDEVLPFTGVEMGQVHRPWIDYEEHHGWFYRSISKVLVEASNGAHFTNSADLGVNFKTKTEHFSSELGVFNGEGYHGKTEANKNLSAEWRLTGHLFATGKKHVHKSSTYADVSFFGQYNKDYKDAGTDFVWYGVHAVYNQKEFLVSAQYVEATKGTTSQKGNGYSVNGEYRFAKDWNILGRYDNFNLDTGTDKTRTIAGLAYKYNKNVEFIVNYMKEDVANIIQSNSLMLSAEVNW